MKSFRINLIDKKERTQIQVTPELGILASAAAALLIIMSSAGFQFYKKSSNTKKHKVLQAQSVALSAKVATLQTQNNSPDKATLLVSALDEILGKKLNWSEVFKELSTVIPKNVWVTSLQTSFEEGKWVVTFKGSSSSQNLVSKFFEAMENSYHFNNVMIKYSSKKENIAPNLYEFEISVPLKHLEKVAYEAK